MAINLREFENTRHIGVKRDKKNHHRFLVEYTLTNSGEKKRYRSIFNADPYLGKRDSLNAAYMYRTGLLNDKKLSHSYGTVMNATVNDYCDKFINSKLNPKTQATYQSVYNSSVKEYLGSIKIKNVTPEQIRSILFKVEKDGFSVSKKQRVWMILKFIFEMAVKDKLIGISPVLPEHKVIKSADAEKKVVLNPKQEYRAIHASILKVFKDKPLDKALFLFGFAGRRKGEALAIKWEHVDFENQQYIIPKENSKIKADLKFDFSDELRDLLLEIRPTPTSTGRIFKRVSGSVTPQAWKIREDTGIEKYSFHYMRNVLVSAFADKMTVPELSSLLGHKDIQTVNKYLTLPREQATLKSVSLSKDLLG